MEKLRKIERLMGIRILTEMLMVRWKLTGMRMGILILTEMLMEIQMMTGMKTD